MTTFKLLPSLITFGQVFLLLRPFFKWNFNYKHPVYQYPDSLGIFTQVKVEETDRHTDKSES